MESLWFLHNLAEIHVDGAATDGRYTLVELSGPAGDQAPLHLHTEADEAFYVLEGELTLWAGDQKLVLGPGAFVNAPRGIPHTYRITGAGPARWLNAVSPAGFDAFLRAAGRPAAVRELPAADVPPDPALLAQQAAEHGIEILGPPGMLPCELANTASRS